MDNLYQRYTTTSVFSTGVSEDEFLTWSKNYFKTHYKGLLPRDKKARILEVGCGYGKYIAALSDMGYSNCIGVDISPEQIDYAKVKLKLTNVELADAIDWLDDKECLFDCIIGLDLLEHLPTVDLLNLGFRMYKALKPDGVVIFQVPNGISPLNPIVYGDLTHVRAFTPQSMQQFFLHVGFTPKEYYEIPPDIHGLYSGLRRVLWAVLLKPVIGMFVRVLHGRVMGGDIYTSNFIACAKK